MATAGISTAEGFLERAVIGNIFEIQSSEIARQKSHNDQIRNIAERIVQDHVAIGDRLMKAAERRQVPSSLDEEHEQMLQRLRGASDTSFDQDYLDSQVQAHREAVETFDAYSQTGDDDSLKQLAEQTLPALRDHLQEIQQIQGRLQPAMQEGRPQEAMGSEQAAHIASEQLAPMGSEQPPQMGHEQEAQIASEKLAHMGSESEQEGQIGSLGSEMGEQQVGAMPKPAGESGEPVEVSRLMNMSLYDSRGERVGDISRVVVDMESLCYVVVGVGGFLGLGERVLAIPTDSVKLVGDALVLVAVTEDEINKMPTFGMDEGAFKELSDDEKVRIVRSVAGSPSS